MPKTRPTMAAEDVAAREWPPLRARIVDVAAALDRLDVAGESAELQRLRDEAEGLLRTMLQPGDADRAERVLAQLSRRYDPEWRARFAAGESAID